jgi:hypothetical protein
MTTGRQDPAIHPMASLIRDIPQLEEDVILRVPVAPAPNSMAADAVSLSPCRYTPLTSGCGILLEKYSGISFCGVMG